LKKSIIAVFLVLSAISACVIYYYSSGGKNINDNISISNKLSAKELIDISNSYVDKYWDNRTYHIGKISMLLDENLEGKVEIWYKDDKIDKNGIPSIITVEIDTKKNKILRIINQERNSKIVPGKINIDKFSIDSTDVIDVAKNVFEQNEDFIFTTVWLSTANIEKNEGAVWNVSFLNEQTKKVFYLVVDAYTGEIYRKEAE